MDAKENFLNSIKDYILANDLNISSFSKAVGINRRSVTWWFHSRSPKLDSLIKVAEYMNCSIDYLIGKTDEAKFYKNAEPGNFYSRYTLLKNKQGLNDYKVAKLCGVGTGVVAKWKTGMIPDFEMLVKLCGIFDCSFDFLVGR